MAESNRVSDADLQGLPHWAQVAFAVRCVRRVQRLLRTLEGPGAESVREDIERALGLAEQSAELGQPQPGLADAIAATEGHASQLGPPQELPPESPSDPAFDPVPQSVALAAAAVARAAWEPSADAVILAVASAQDAAEEADEPEVLTAMRRDLDPLQQTAQAGGWTDETPVGPSFFGNL